LVASLDFAPPTIEIKLGVERWNDGRRSCSFPSCVHVKPWTSFWSPVHRIRRCLGSKSTRSQEKPFGRVVKNGRRGNARTKQPTLISDRRRPEASSWQVSSLCFANRLEMFQFPRQVDPPVLPLKIRSRRWHRRRPR
jgi:hypothetical protein